MLHIASTSGRTIAGVTNYMLTSVSTSIEDKNLTIANYLEAPNVKLVMHLLFLQALVMVHARGQSMLILDESRSSEVSNDVESDRRNDQNRGSIGVPFQAFSLVKRTASFGICWISASFSLILTTSVCFDVLLQYKIERIHSLGGSQNAVSGDLFKQAIMSVFE